MKSIMSLFLATFVTLAGCGHQPNATLTIHPVSPTAHVTPAYVGALCVQLSNGQTSKAFSILSTIKDISTLKMTVSGPNLLVPLTQTFTASDLAKGSAAAQYNSLSAGSYVVSVTAHDAKGNLLGQTSSAASVVAGQTTTVCLVVVLNSNVGNLGVGVTFQEVLPTVNKTDSVNCGACQ